MQMLIPLACSWITSMIALCSAAGLWFCDLTGNGQPLGKLTTAPFFGFSLGSWANLIPPAPDNRVFVQASL